MTLISYVPMYNVCNYKLLLCPVLKEIKKMLSLSFYTANTTFSKLQGPLGANGTDAVRVNFIVMTFEISATA